MRARRICLLTFDFPGPIRNGGMGTALLALAELLRDAGHAVTILYPPAHSETLPLTHWRAHYAAQGLDFVPLFLEGEDKFLALGAYHWLKARRFDAIHFHEMRGAGHWLTVAKRCGLAFADTTLICQVHSPTLWHFAHSAQFLTRVEELETDFMERGSAEGADIVLSPSRHMLDEVARMGWALPARAEVLPNLPPAGALFEPRPRHIEEIVFFGRLEARKGLDLFCEAIRRLPAPPARVTFLGKVAQMGQMHALAWLADATAGWTVPWRVVNDLGAREAQEFLDAPAEGGGARLAVIASRMENAPYAVIECLAAGRPFLAPAVGGIPELVAAEDQAAVLYPRSAPALAAALARALADGARPARPAVAEADARTAWRAFHDALPAPAPCAAAAPSAPVPRVSVCMTSFNRVAPLAEAIAAVEAQTHPDLELVLVDDASDDPAARAFLDALEPRFAARGWRLVRLAENGWQGAARARAVAESAGEFLLFMDDDNAALPEQVAVMLRAALVSGADVVTCQQQEFLGGGPAPTARARAPARLLRSGPSAAVAAYANMLGDANLLVRRAAFERLGGFTPERAWFEDWEFLQAALHAGLRVECLPEILTRYRIWGGAQTARLEPDFLYRSHARAMRPALAATPPALRPALRLALESRLAATEARREHYWAMVPAPTPGQARLARLPGQGAEAMVELAEVAAASGQAAAARLLLAQAQRLAPGHPAARALAERLGG
ncbi:MAG: glycosyltransferase [Rubritepida sp.]|nr:glycosyltransferase [Rubritepida sp.]